MKLAASCSSLQKIQTIFNRYMININLPQNNLITKGSLLISKNALHSPHLTIKALSAQRFIIIYMMRVKELLYDVRWGMKHFESLSEKNFPLQTQLKKFTYKLTGRPTYGADVRCISGGGLQE